MGRETWFAQMQIFRSMKYFDLIILPYLVVCVKVVPIFGVFLVKSIGDCRL